MKNSLRSYVGFAGAVGTIGAMAVAPGISSAAVGDATLTVSTRGAVSGGATVPVGTTDVLTAGATYRVVVVGTYSPWFRRLWADYPKVWVSCGTPEVGPMFPTPGVTNGVVGSDAAFMFGSVARGGCGNLRLPAPSGIAVSTGGAFTRPAYDNAPTTPAADHIYRFSVVGAGQPLRVRINDRVASDNYGDLKLAFSKTAEPGVPGPAGAPGADGAPGIPGAAGATAPAPTGVLATTGVKKPVVLPCISRRTLTVHLRSKNIRKGTGRARLSGKGVHGRKLVVRHGPRLVRIPVSLRGLRKARYKVTIKFIRKSGYRQTVVRRFRACALAVK